MIKKVTIILFFVILCSHLYSIEEKQVISKILFYGNTKTKETIIKKALYLKIGQEFDPDLIEKSRKRLMDLNIFTHVDIETKESEEGTILLVIVKEKPSILFNLLLGYAEETYKNFLGSKLDYNNLLGKNQKLWLTTIPLGNLKKIEFGYQNNYYIDFFWGISFSNLWYKNDFYDFKEDRFTGKIFMGNKISKLETNIWANYEKIRIDNSSLLHPDAPEELFKLGINITYNSKDWEFFPSKGIVAETGFYRALNRNWKTVYDRSTFRISSFFNLYKKNVLALDLRSKISEGNVPIYDSLFFGGLNTLRGFSVQTYSGSNYIVFTSEYRIPIEKRTGTAFYFFSDFGSITNRKEDFSIKKFKSDFGIGLFWVLMEESVFRIDLSISPKFKLILDYGWKF
jgi:outer membrane protein insertion porin family